MDIITIDGMVEHDFRHSVEDMLRLDQVDEAVERLQALVAPYCGPNGILPPCFVTAARREVEIGGWSRLGERLCDHDRPQRKITAIGVTLADATRLGGPGPSRGRLAPFIKTYYFSDEAYPFSGATRDDLLDGYSRDGFEWQGDYQATDVTLSVRGLDDLHGPIVTLERQLLARPDPDEDEIRAGTIGACYVAVLIHRALRDTIRKHGVPRPLCVIAACDGIYPLFDAPVVGIEHGSADPLDAEEGEEELVAGGVGEGSLLNLITRSHHKTMALTLSAEDAEEGWRQEEIAAAQQLEAAGESALAGALDLTRVGGADDPKALDEPAELHDRPPPAGWAPPLPEPREFAWLADGDFALAEVEIDEAEYPPADGGDAFDPCEPTPLRGHNPEDGELADEQDSSDPPLPRASHSLRARIVATTDAAPAPARGLGAIASWLSRILLRR